MPTLQHPGYCAIVAAWPLTLMALLCASLLMHPSGELQRHGCHLKSCTKTTPRVSRQQQLFLSHTNVCEILSILKVFSVPPLKKKKNLITFRTFSGIHPYAFFFLLFLFLLDDIQTYEKQGDTTIGWTVYQYGISYIQSPLHLNELNNITVQHCCCDVRVCFLL